jgi:hypothetical protein
MILTIALEATDVKDSIIASPNFLDAEAIVNSFNKKELAEWKVGVQCSVETNDWTGLIMHHMYILDYWMVGSHVITTTVKLQK